MDGFPGDVGDGDCGDTTDGDDHAQVLLHALEDSLYSLEGTFHDSHFGAWLAGEVEVIQEHDVLVIMEGGHLHEGGHLGIGDADDVIASALFGGLCHVAQGFKAHVGLPQLTNLLLGGMDEDEVVDSGYLPQFLSYVRFHPAVPDREEVLDTQTVKLILHEEFAAVGGTHGEPGKIIHILYMWMKRFSEVTRMALEFLIRTQITQIF